MGCFKLIIFKLVCKVIKRVFVNYNFSFIVLVSVNQATIQAQWINWGEFCLGNNSEHLAMM